MADYEYEIMGWRDTSGNQFEGVPSESDFSGRGNPITGKEVDGLLIKYWDPNDRDSVEYHWVFQTERWGDLDSTFGDIDFMITVTYGQTESA